MNNQQVFDLLTQNPSWTQEVLCHDGSYCNTGYFLHQKGISDELLEFQEDSFETEDEYGHEHVYNAIALCSLLSNMPYETWRVIMILNDDAIDWEHNVAALKAWLLDGYDQYDASIIAKGGKID